MQALKENRLYTIYFFNNKDDFKQANLSYLSKKDLENELRIYQDSNSYDGRGLTKFKYYIVLNTFDKPKYSGTIQKLITRALNGLLEYKENNGFEGKIIEQTKQKLDKLQNNNDHSGYMLEVARFCKDDKYIKIFEHIYDLHELDGYLVFCLGDYRNFHWENLKNCYADKLEPLGIFPLNRFKNDEIPF